MTCVCGIAEGGRVVLGGASASVSGHGDRDLGQPKVFERGGIRIGSSGEIALPVLFVIVDR